MRSHGSGSHHLTIPANVNLKNKTKKNPNGHRPRRSSWDHILRPIQPPHIQSFSYSISLRAYAHSLQQSCLAAFLHEHSTPGLGRHPKIGLQHRARVSLSHMQAGLMEWPEKWLRPVKASLDLTGSPPPEGSVPVLRHAILRHFWPPSPPCPVTYSFTIVFIYKVFFILIL